MGGLELATHWTSGGQLPKAFVIIMLGVTYGLIVLLGVGAYRLLKGAQRPPEEPGGGAGDGTGRAGSDGDGSGPGAGGLRGGGPATDGLPGGRRSRRQGPGRGREGG
ncbi:MAG TPA: hypothetical protein VIL38_07830 [Thermaerobacter sp.]